MKLTFICLMILQWACSSDSEFSSTSRSRSPKASSQEADLNSNDFPDGNDNFGEAQNSEEPQVDPDKCEEGTEGRIVLSWDEWLFSNKGFSKGSNTATFIGNVTNWLKRCNRKSGHKFHALSSVFALTESHLSQVLSSSGYTYTTGLELELTLENLRQYDWIFLSGFTPISGGKEFADIFEAYVKDGGNILIAGGTGMPYGHRGEAAYYNPLLHRFGLNYTGGKSGTQGLKSVTMDHKIFTGVSKLYYKYGTPITTYGNNPRAKILNGGRFAVYDGSIK